MIRHFAALAALAVVGAAAAPLFPTDHETLRPDPAVRHTALTGTGVNLAAAVGLAESTVKGKAETARIDLAAKTAVVTVYNEGKCVEVVVGANGAIASQKEIPRFPGLGVTGEWTETGSGLKYFDLVVGSGAQPNGPATRVRVHYTGYLTDGTKFDSSVDRGKPYDTALNRVIPGWTEGVGSMKVGGKRKLVVPYPLAYRAQGKPPVIPPKATLIFDVELLQILP